MAKSREQFDDSERDLGATPPVGTAGPEVQVDDRELAVENDLWKKMADFDALPREEQIKLLDEIVEHDGDIIQGKYFISGYDFFIINEQALTDSQKISEAQDAAQEAILNGYYETAGSDSEATGEYFHGREALAKIMRRVGEDLMSEYKIHLQPRREMLGEVAKRLIGMFRQPGNEHLREIVGAFKIKGSPSEPGATEIFPEVVIYSRTGAARDRSGMTAGRRNAEQVLAAVLEAIRGLEAAAQPDATPRYNARINELVYIAQSGGDFKKFLGHYGLLDKYFDPKTNYAYRYGEQPFEPASEHRVSAEEHALSPVQPAPRATEEQVRIELERIKNGEYDADQSLAGEKPAVAMPPTPPAEPNVWNRIRGWFKKIS